ncbi:uncharacterized protein LOC134437775 [Engraulis encrasicolus]|uniref:uncharacterized protein LOC134437775 n=1 Tax=Engraulis encrasicolus TaxID=184585 RepID=UPI002FD0E72A
MSSLGEKSNVSWSIEEMNALIGIWASTEIQEKLEGAVRKAKIYEEIRVELAGVGFHRTVDQITNKLKKIKKEYRDYNADMARSGAGRSKIKSGINVTLLENVMGRRPANRLDGALNSRVVAANERTATEILEGMCNQYVEHDEADDLEAPAEEPPAEPAEPAPSSSVRTESRKGKRKSPQEELLESMERMEERRDHVFLEQSRQFNEAFLQRMDTSSTALINLLGRIVTAIEKEQ